MSSEIYHLGLTGYPLSHSLSPQLHQAALQALGLEGSYRLFPVLPLPEGAAALNALLARLRQGELHGLNVTIPHKLSVLAGLDETSPAVQAIGAANTLLCREGRLMGENTDAAGFWADVQALLAQAGRSEVKVNTTALVLGAGGSARAVVFALLQAGWQVIIASRRLQQASELVAAFAPAAGGGQSRLQAIELQVQALGAVTPDLLVNTTPVGMAPNRAASPWPAQLPLPSGAVVYDLVYRPAETVLVRTASQAGLFAATGLGMLVEQAARSFELWTGRPAPRPAMWQVIQTEAQP